MSTALVDDSLAGETSSAFAVRLDNFEGPFDLLLQLIGKHKLDVTEIALSAVTDEFITHLRALGDELVALETARLTLRAQHGLAADRGRIVREAISVVLADLAEQGENSVLLKRLRG